MKINVYASTHALEAIARGEEPSQWQLEFTVGDDRSKRFPLAEQIEVKLPDRNQAVIAAAKLLRAEAEATRVCYEERIAKLEALEWNGQTGSAS